MVKGKNRKFGMSKNIEKPEENFQPKISLTKTAIGK